MTFSVQSEPDIFKYINLSPKDRIESLDTQLNDRERQHWELSYFITMLSGNPEPGEHAVQTTGVCPCGKCELARLTKLRTGLEYSINQLRALKASLS